MRHSVLTAISPKHINTDWTVTKFKSILYILLSTLTAVGLGGCRKNIEEIRPYDYTVGEVRTLLRQVPNSLFSVKFVLKNLQNDTILLTDQGIRVSLVDPDNLFENYEGIPVPCSTCDFLELEVTTVTQKGDWLSRGLGTIDVNGQFLETGGMVYVKVSCAGQPLALSAGKTLTVNIPATDLQSDLIVSQSVFLNDTTFVGWMPTSEPVFWAQWPTPNVPDQTGYELRLSQLGWNGAFKPMNEPNGNGTFCVELPSLYTEKNSVVMLVFNDQNSAIQLTSQDDKSSTFCSDMAPIGYPVRVVVVCKYSGQFWFDAKTIAETGSNDNIVSEPQPKLQTEVVQYFKNL